MALAGGALAELTRSYFDLRWHLDPVSASQAGLTLYDDHFGRFSTEAVRPHLVALKSLTAALEEAEFDDLDEEIERTALLNEVRVTLHRYEKELPQAHNPEFWLSHLLSGLHVLLVRERDRTHEARSRALIGRLNDVAAFLDDARAGLTDPVALFAETAQQVLGGAAPLVREAKAAASEPETAEAVAAAADAALAALASFQTDLARWAERGTARFAVGEDAFNFHLHYEHALRDTAPELWRYGHRLVEELQADLTARAASLGSKDWPQLITRLRADHPSGSDVVAAYAREMKRARGFVEEKGLVTIPDGPLEVIPTPDFLRPLIPFAAYDPPGAYAADRTGWFYVTPPDPVLPAQEQEARLRDHSNYELAATALHEGYPGHHLHFLRGQGQGSDVRKLIWTPLTVEGWALYCEDMMAECGFYRGPEEQLFQRLHLLWRAVRILLDVGLHTRGMAFEQGVDMLVTHLHVDRANAEAEVRRYCSTPTYQMSYAVGRRELLSLRDAYRRARGTAYSLRGFHDAVMSWGGLPVSLMRWGLGLSE
jgi:uncharacterized protein (DUF885 family)